MKKRNIINCARYILVLFALAMIINVETLRVYAIEEVQAAPMVVIEKYEVTNQKIIPGEDFSLTLTLKNNNQTQVAKNVLIDISNPDGVAPVYGTVSQIFIGDIGPGESKNITVDYNSWTTITSDTLDFYVTAITDATQNYIILRVPSGADSPFKLLSVIMPTEIKVNETVAATVTFRVLGDENVSNVGLYVGEGEEILNSSQIGTVTSGITKTQQISLFFDETGVRTLDIILEYADENGQKKTANVGTAVVTVSEAEEIPQETVSPEPDTDTNDGANNILLMGISGILILAIFVIVVIVLQKKK